MDSNKVSSPGVHQLTVSCFGRIELTEDEPISGTYWTRYAVNLGVCTSLTEAIDLAERRISQPPITLIDEAHARGFAPERILIHDFRHRLALGGEVAARAVDWCEPVMSEDEAHRVRKAATELRVEAAIERGWDNYSTARGLDRRAELLEARLVDAVWRAETTDSLKIKNSSKNSLFS